MIARVVRPAFVLFLALSVPAPALAAGRHVTKPRAHHRTTATLGNNRWRPVSIGFENVVVVPKRREPWLVLDPKSNKVTGSGGCNRITGSYQAHDSTLRFGPLVTTRMACPGMQTEAKFLRALQGTRRYRISGRTLDLLDGGGEPLARLEERNLR